MVKVVAGLSK